MAARREHAPRSQRGDAEEPITSPFTQCEAEADVGQGGFVVPKAVPVSVAGDIDVRSEGDRAVHIDTQHETFSDSLRAFYWADEVGAVCPYTPARGARLS